MEKKAETMQLAQYRVLSVLAPEGHAVAIQFIALYPSGELGGLPAIRMPLDTASDLCDAIQTEIRRVRNAH